MKHRFNTLLCLSLTAIAISCGREPELVQVGQAISNAITGDLQSSIEDAAARGVQDIEGLNSYRWEIASQEREKVDYVVYVNVHRDGYNLELQDSATCRLGSDGGWNCTAPSFYEIIGNAVYQARQEAVRATETAEGLAVVQNVTVELKEPFVFGLRDDDVLCPRPLALLVHNTSAEPLDVLISGEMTGHWEDREQGKEPKRTSRGSRDTWDKPVQFGSRRHLTVPGNDTVELEGSVLDLCPWPSQSRGSMGVNQPVPDVLVVTVGLWSEYIEFSFPNLAERVVYALPSTDE